MPAIELMGNHTLKVTTMSGIAGLNSRHDLHRFDLSEVIGLEIGQAITTAPGLTIDAEQRNYHIFHVPEALGKALVPAQEFVRENGVKPVLGFGGLLPSGDLS